MHPVPSSPALRLLASWHAARAEVDRVLEPLLAHGPVAASRVGARLPELHRLMQEERVAFQRFADVANGRDERPVDGVTSLLARPRDPS